MREPMETLFRELGAAAVECESAARDGRWDAARELLRHVLSAGSKLHARLGLLAEMEDDAKFVAEVDRALMRERNGRVKPIPGDQPLPFPKAPRRGKGKGE